MANEIGILRTYLKKNTQSQKVEVHHDFEVLQAPASINPNKCSSIQIFPLTAATIYINGMLWTPALNYYLPLIFFENSEVTTVFKVTL